MTTVKGTARLEIQSGARSSVSTMRETTPAATREDAKMQTSPRVAKLITLNKPDDDHGMNLVRVKEYLPENYGACIVHLPGDPMILIVGIDYAGWTWDDYVEPRLASGLIWAEVLS